MYDLVVAVVCPALVACGVVPGHVAKGEVEGDGEGVDLETRDVGGDRVILGVKPLQACVQEARRPACQSDVISLDGSTGLNGHLLRMI